MTERLLAVAVTPLWLASATGWTAVVAVHFTLTPWRFLP